MKLRSLAYLSILCGALSLTNIAHLLSEEPTGSKSEKEAGAAEEHLPIAMARERAKLMHNIFSATLDSMHHYYFHANKAVLPARAMEDIFAEVADGSHVKVRWISVNTKAMSLDHEPTTAIEKKAAEQLSKGKPEFEVVENGTYSRAGPIPLGSGCLGCHTSAFSKPTDTPRLAGLVISMPVRDE